MAEKRDASVDPRFDPVFQRGYDPQVHGGRRPRSAPRHGTQPVPIVTTPPEPVVAVPAADHGAELEAATPPALSARNPFRIALLVTSVVLIVVAALMIWNKVGEDVYYGGFSGTNQGLLFRSQLIATLPVPLLTGGMIGVILWLAIGAISSRRGVEDPDE
jgi:hypothetical protein